MLQEEYSGSGKMKEIRNQSVQSPLCLGGGD